nr:protein FAR1-RELATED SEQUENCE 5-like [Aegilops tauschii subsp. strangulata]
MFRGCKLPGFFRQKECFTVEVGLKITNIGAFIIPGSEYANYQGQIAGARAISANNSLPSGGTSAHSAGTNASTGAGSLGEQTISEPATPESAGINADMEGSNMEAYSTPKTPLQGTKFDTLESARDHYSTYARRTGFAIRQQFKKERVDGTISRDRDELQDVENPAGIVKKRKKKKVVRIECEAHMYLSHDDAWWTVDRFEDTHNHPLIKKPSLTKFLSSHRYIPKEEEHFLRVLHGCNVETVRQMQLMSWFYGSAKDVPYTTQDIDNQRAKFRLEHRHKDVGSTIAYFQEMRAKDSYFYWRIKLDDEDWVENLFWIDGASRRAYAKYNDCLSFDTTYMTNMYKMPCAPFIGINNHGQSIQFGCGFVRNELKENFVWLFNTFLHAMGGVAPKNIITDQDFAMRSAIDEVFLNIIHRNCRWHIMKKAQEKLGKLMADDKPLNKAFKDCRQQLDCKLENPYEYM